MNTPLVVKFHTLEVKLQDVMNQTITLAWLDRAGINLAQEIVKREHYLHTRIASVCSVQGYAIEVFGATAGFLLFGRPQCQRSIP